MFDFKDKVVIVTGGTRGIGYETVLSFCKCQATVILFGSKSATVDEACSKLKTYGYNVDGYYPNLLNYDEVKKTIDEIYSKYGHIDILINNAGVSDSKKIEETSSEDFARVVDINLKAMFNVIKVVSSYMKEKNFGVILNTSSMVSIYGQASGVSYPASKFGVNGLTKSLALEFAPFNIRVNAVAPGIIKTDMLSNVSDEVLKPLIKSIPLGRIGLPTDIANAFLFLASDMASYITGVILSVDGAAKN